MAFAIRQWTKGDIPELAKLFDQYRLFYRQKSNIPGAESFLRERYLNNESVVFVATSSDDGRLVGFTQLYPLFSSVNMARTWLLNDLFVNETARRTGVGRDLLRAAKVFGERSGAIGLELETEKTNLSAKALYEEEDWLLDKDHDRYAITCSNE